MNWKLAAVPLAVIIPLVLVLAAGFGTNPHALPFALKDQKAPALRLVTLDGVPVDEATLQGKPIVLNFWSTWCEPCKWEHAGLQQTAQEYSGRAQFFGVIYQDTAEAARGYVAKHGGAYPQLVDPQAQTAIEFGVSGVPESYFIDGAGIVRHRKVGPVTPDLLRAQLESMLGSI